MKEEEDQPASSLVKQRGGVILKTFPWNPPLPISTPNSEMSWKTCQPEIMCVYKHMNTHMWIYTYLSSGP